MHNIAQKKPTTKGKFSQTTIGVIITVNMIAPSRLCINPLCVSMLVIALDKGRVISKFDINELGWSISGNTLPSITAKKPKSSVNGNPIAIRPK